MSKIYPTKASHLMRVLANRVEEDKEDCPQYLLIMVDGEDVMSSTYVHDASPTFIKTMEKIKLELLLGDMMDEL